MSMTKKTGKFYAKKLMSGSVALMISQSSMKLVKLLVLPVMTYYLSPRDFGIIASIKMVQGFLILLYNPGVISGLSRLYYDTEDEKERKMLFGSTLLFFTLISVSVTLLIILLGEEVFRKAFNEFDLYPYGIIAVLIAALVQPKRLWSSLMTFKYKVTKIAFFSFIQLAIDVGISLYLVVIAGWGVNGRVAGMVAGVVFIFIVSIVTLIKYIQWKFSVLKMVEILKFSLPLAPAIWAYSVLDIADRFLIEHYIGLTDLGIYSVAYILSSVPLFLSLGFRKMWTPIFFENMNEKRYEQIDSMVKLFLILYSAVCGGLILYSEEVVEIFLAKGFNTSKTIIPWVVLGVFFLGILPVSTSFITYEKKFKKVSLNALFSALVNIILNIILLPRIGVIGSAIATFIAYLIYFMLNVFTAGRMFFAVINSKNFLIPLLFLTISVSLYFHLKMNILSFVIKTGLVLLFFYFLIKSNYFNKKEKEFMGALLSKGYNKISKWNERN